MISYKSDLEDNAFGYVAPFLGNGNMAFEVDFEGTMQNNPDLENIRSNSDLRIWWAGRRYLHKSDFDLVPFGCFCQNVKDEDKKKLKLKSFEQKLDTDNALSLTDCNYENNINIKSEVFIHHDYNLISIKKDFDKKLEYTFEYFICDVKNKDNFPELFSITDFKITDNGVDIEYKIDAGMCPYKGIIRVFSPFKCAFGFDGNKVFAKTDKSSIFYVLFCDNFEREDYIEYTQKVKKSVLLDGYENVKNSHIKKWQAYYNEGYAKIDDELINNAYSTAQYHLKCFTTDWSLPVGLNNGSWQGRYFAFDEFYMFMGLITSNHLSAAKKIPKFRFDGLDYAAFRGSAPNLREEARYPWETLENGTEGAPSGFWHDHIFHMACIACDEYYYYKFTLDKDFLKNIAYPVIKKCATFYMKHSIYKTENGKTIVGKCTDLERLGASRENAYMTTCGVIKTLQIFDEVSKILDVDFDFAKECAKTANELKNSLPTDGEKYVPYPDCDTSSIALLAGTYPFDVIERNSILQKGGIESYLDSENKVGNMYSVGTGVCSWYMTWKAVVFARHLRKEETYKAIQDAAKNTGYFGEMYEINDLTTKTIYRPWFTTAAGMLVHSVNEMLMQYDYENIYIAPALPKSIKSFSFKLAAYNGICVETVVKDLKLKKLIIINSKKPLKIVFPKHIFVEKEFKNVENNIITI